MATLDGSARPISLGQGISVRAPGLRGRAEAQPVSDGGPTRGPDVDGSGPLLEGALTAQGFLRLQVLTLEVEPLLQAPAGDVRSPVTGEPGFEVNVPDLGDEVAQVLVAVDENGMVTWNFPVEDGGDLAPTQRGGGGDVRFIVPAFAGTEPIDAAPTRSVFGLVGTKVLELLALPLGELIAPPLAGAAVRLWEAKARVARLRPFTPADYTRADAPDLTEADWQRLASGRSLWFVHGAFMSAPTAFGAFPADLMATLNERYGGRIAAIDQHTMGVSPMENAEWVRERVPEGLRLEADIICHSRGGLVSRALAGQLGNPVFDVGKIVHVASANHGTALATPNNLVPLIDRMTTLVNLLPDGPTAALEAVLSSVLVVVKIIAKYGLTGIPGIIAMDAEGDFLAEFNATALGAEQYAIAADYTPSGGWRAMTLRNVQDVATDVVFGNVPNDLLVPTAGVYEGDDAMQIPPERRLVLPQQRGVNHNDFFGQRDVAEQIVDWLSG